MSADKYPSIFSRQMEAIVYIENGNIANQIQGFTIDYGKFILMIILSQEAPFTVVVFKESIAFL